MSGVDRSFGLDLVRCAAIGLVLAAHFGAMFHAPTTDWGARLQGQAALVGVDLFFALSGLLIGRLLFAIAEAGPTLAGWRVFMLRRWLRTLPLYWAWLLVILLVLPAPLATTALRFATLTQNLAWPLPAGHWFMVSWSLTVEEFFYLLFSTLFLGLAARFGVRRAAWATLFAFLAVPAICRQSLAATGDYMGEVITVAALRLDAVAYGVALAWLERTRGLPFRHPFAAAALGLALPLPFWLHDIAGLGAALPLPTMTYLNAERIATSLGLALLLPAALALPAPPAPLRRLVLLGSQLSYGIYLMHMTVIEAVARTAPGWPAPVQIAADAALIAGLAYVSFRCFEAPILALRPAQPLTPVAVRPPRPAPAPVPASAVPPAGPRASAGRAGP